MNARRCSETPNDNDARKDQSGAAGLMVLVVVLILMVCAAATLLLTLPQTVDGAVAAAMGPRQLSGSTAREPTFHERYPSAAAAETPDAPTF